MLVFARGGTVVVATGEGFRDALSVVGLAGLEDAPVVLTRVKSLPSQAKSTLQMLKPKKIYVAGGPLAVADSVLNEIQKITGVKPTRVYGQTAHKTSLAPAKAGAGRWNDTFVIATDMSYKDALSVAPICYVNHWPVVLGIITPSELKSSIPMA